MAYLYYEGATTQLNGSIFELMQMEHHILFQRRKELKMTQQQVADKAGVQLRQYQRLENGERNISSSSGRIMLSICAALRLDPYLFLDMGNEKPETKYVNLPPIETQGLTYAIPSLAYYNLVSAIPKGMVCTDDELLACLRTSYGMDFLEVKHDLDSVELHVNNSFPYWRIVSQRGYLINSFYCSKDRRKTLLEEEGIQIIKVGDNESYRVDEFEYHRFDISNLKITLRKTGEQRLEQFKNIR